jgi:hypothetical protein
MATKSQQFRTQQQRDARPPKAQRPARRRRDFPVDTALPGVSASDRKVGSGSSGSRNVSARAARKGGAAMEDSATGKPSRKSTRKSEGRVKRTTKLQNRAIAYASAPATRAAKPRTARKH